MKILLASGNSIYIKNHPRSEKNNCGFAHMMCDIAEMLVQQGAEVESISQTIFTERKKINSWVLLRKKWFDILISIKPFYLQRALKVIRSSCEPLSFRLRILLYYMTGAYVEKILNKGNYDIVHVHGISEGSLPYLYACARTGTPSLVTLHGLLSFSDTTNTTDFSRSFERSFLKFSAEHKYNISVVSTGIKKRVADWMNKDFDSIFVVCNPVKNLKKGETSKKKKSSKYSILCVGNLNVRKNQILVLKAYKKLKNTYGSKINLTFIGGGDKKDELMDYCEEHDLKDVYFTGLIDREKVNKYYEKADLLVTASIDEGFGLPIIEAFSHGVPALSFDDIDAIPDVYSEKAMILVEERSVDAFANGIIKALETNWDEKEIKESANKFNFLKIGYDYFRLLADSKSQFITKSNLDQILDEAIKSIDFWRKKV